MFRKIYFIILLLHFHSNLFGLNVAILESHLPDGNYADSAWREVIYSMGHTPSIVPYSTLDNTLFFSNTDLLIVSCGSLELSSTAVNTILAFIKTGKPVYLQCEYLPDYTTNIAFRDIVIRLGGSFEWGNLVPGDLMMNIIGSYSTTPNEAHLLDFFWYSIAGKGDCNMVNFLELDGEYHGFQYIPDNPDYGTISTTADGDWAQYGYRADLMENIIYHLLFPPIIPEDKKVSLGKDTSFCNGETLLLHPTPMNDHYEWQDGSIGPEFLAQEEGVYWVTAKLDCGDVTDTLFVEAENCDCPIFTPNAFSPNSDNINDEFSAHPSCEFSDFSMLIYNRWGELVFQSNDQAESWDGTTKGENSPMGVYAYLIQYSLGDDNVKHIYGDVTLIR